MSKIFTSQGLNLMRSTKKRDIMWTPFYAILREISNKIWILG